MGLSLLGAEQYICQHTSYFHKQTQLRYLISHNSMSFYTYLYLYCNVLKYVSMWLVCFPICLILGDVGNVAANVSRLWPRLTYAPLSEQYAIHYYDDGTNISLAVSCYSRGYCPLSHSVHYFGSSPPFTVSY